MNEPPTKPAHCDGNPDPTAKRHGFIEVHPGYVGLTTWNLTSHTFTHSLEIYAAVIAGSGGAALTCTNTYMTCTQQD
jgi:hypothetical protein